MGIAEEFIRDNPSDPTNVFHWDSVELNLPGSKGYDPSRPWMAKYRMEDGRIAANLFIFVDNLRPTSPSQEDAWQATHRAASTLSYLGIQDAAQKHRNSSQCPGAWAGTLVGSVPVGPFVSVTHDKWEKTKGELFHLQR